MKRNFIFLLSLFLLAGCGGKKSDNPGPGTTPPVIPPAPVAAVLSFPSQNAICTAGTILSTSQSDIPFSWNASANTDSYSLTIKNLLTGVILTRATSLNQLTVTLLRNTPYSWSVTSSSSKTNATAQSDTWKFYNSGPGVVSYAPYPADLTSPTFGQVVTPVQGVISLSWKGTSADNDIKNYDIYFGLNTIPALLKSGVTDMSLSNVPVISGNTYYWKVVTWDNNGNSADSGIYQFSIQ